MGMATKSEDTQKPAPDPEKPAAPEHTAGKQNASEGGDKGKEKKQVEFTEEQQAYVNKLIGDARKEGRDRAAREAEEARKTSEDEAEQKRLEEQKEFEKLANDRKAKLDALEAQVKTLAGQNEKYVSAIKAKLDAERKGLPEHITALLDRLDPADQLEWLAANGEAAKKPTGGSTTPGTPTRPRKPSEPPDPGKMEKQDRFGIRL